MKAFDLSLYLVLDPVLCGSTGMVETARAAAAGGATMIQLRDKQADTRRMIATGLALKGALAGTGTLLIVNDDVEAAIAVGADGVHVGQSDMAALATRRQIGKDMILYGHKRAPGEAASTNGHAPASASLAAMREG